jgi:hypothetical protein
MADNEQERTKQVPIASVKRTVPRPLVSALLEQSGEVAPVDFGRFGKRVGQIIASGAATRDDRARGKGASGRRFLRRYGTS